MAASKYPLQAFATDADPTPCSNTIFQPIRNPHSSPMVKYVKMYEEPESQRVFHLTRTQNSSFHCILIL